MNSNDIIDVDNHIHENYIYHNEEQWRPRCLNYIDIKSVTRKRGVSMIHTLLPITTFEYSFQN